MQITSAALLISIALVVFGIAYYFFTTRHKERMAIIERGLSPDLFKGQANYLRFILMLGIISIGIATGILTGAIIAPWVSIHEVWVMSICIFL
ncbi:MAG: hypothetical protein H7Z72_12830, partial [Bacteroidetes bacterium]|nr:hypothetical protein [Fibrella sp.]